jgi:hypothetical protein
MIAIQNFAAHSKRVQRMAESVGVDLGQAILNGKLRGFPITDIVFRCSRCAEKTTCDAWLDRQVAAVEQTPDFCRNKQLLDGLRG